MHALQINTVGKQAFQHCYLQLVAGLHRPLSLPGHRLAQVPLDRLVVPVKAVMARRLRHHEGGVELLHLHSGVDRGAGGCAHEPAGGRLQGAGRQVAAPPVPGHR